MRPFLAALAWLACGPWVACHASALRFCDEPVDLNAAQKDTLFRFAAVIRAELERTGRGLALISRSGLDLSRFGVRYSHAGLSLKASADTPWSVRQLYYACDEKKPRLYDQGLSGFVLGLDTPELGYVSVVFVPPDRELALERAALDNRQALRLLGANYSANAYAFSERYQNCNQWVMELLATAWGAPAADPDDAQSARAQAQRWLRDQGYVPSAIAVGSRPLMWLGAFIPWIHGDDHPGEDLAERTYRISMPASIEAFVRATVSGATRIEFCHTGRQVVIRRGWDLIPEGCVPGAQDTLIPLD